MRRLWLALAAAAAASCGGERPDPGGAFLEEAWAAYKTHYIHTDGFVLDPDRNGGEATSEGQGYALLRAVWMRDRPTFERVYRWTEERLRRPDGLYSWRWTPAGGGRIVDANTAADADQEIALALVLASAVFADVALLERARALLRAIRAGEALAVEDAWFPAAGNWAVADRIVNLSYFLPYAYPYFARVDPEGGWEQVTAAGYRLIARALAAEGARLVPDFMVVAEDGSIGRLGEDSPLSQDFTSDGMRLYWRAAFDCALHRAIRGCADPLGADQLTRMLARDGRLFTRYAVDGTPLERTESWSFYGAALPYLRAHAPPAAASVRATRLGDETLRRVVDEPGRYYDANWVWFGLALADGLLLSETPPVDAIGR